ncbi:MULTISPECIES: GDSL-type esterase/lipase family protein [unclassified Fusibacter]|uniref:GDSL-type esterase/lipase family protein n=1 Tax=unclassified Fusibacter TaxID=2624464 RepID=UPI001012E0B8|nr:MULTISPECIES: GDSL-type esterase/lipase family protein [unclassified Fusibacter]MCK8060256.1 GDSL-type esterase/lipase family protein [Fusibacter sp. A2]NPE20456.1 hypothetical protein [Fusibacter sp. A1]RXV63661.1 hypothetical protein DWB64_01400 [Fusibacter sp. A1]
MIKKLVCLGDSLTQGYEIDLSARWTQGLKEKLNCEVVNKGISGDTTAGMLARFYHDVVSEKPSHVLIMGGTNDLFFDISFRQIIYNIFAMTRQAKFNGIEVIIGIPPMSYADLDSSDESIIASDRKHSKRVEDYRRLLMEYCTQDERSFIDFNEFLTPDDFIADKLHPNEAGQLLMRDSVIKGLSSFLNE